MPRVDSRTESAPLRDVDLHGRRRILIADDVPALRALLGAVLRTDGYDVVEESGGAAVRARTCEMLAGPSEGGAFDRVLSVVHMPTRSGLEVLEAFAGSPAAPLMVLMTAFASEDLRTQAAHLGASAVLEKPFDPEESREVMEVTFIWNEARRQRIAGTGDEHV